MITKISGNVHFFSKDDCLLGLHADLGEAVSVNDPEDVLEILRISIGFVIISFDIIFFNKKSGD